MPIVTICREYDFEASHQLPHHAGKCHDLHGHSYRLEVEVAGETRPVHAARTDSGMILDFAALDYMVKTEAIDVLDHHHLNNIIDYPTAELIAMWIWDAMRKRLSKVDTHPESTITLMRVRLYETRRSFAEISL